MDMRVAAVDAMGERAKRMPPAPRFYVGPYTFLPLVDDAWEPVKDKWVLPGRQVLTTDEVVALAQARGLTPVTIYGGAV